MDTNDIRESENNTFIDKPHVDPHITHISYLYYATGAVCCFFKTGWELIPHWHLPEWLKDNEFLWHFHRPQLHTFKQCFKSVFSIHTETGNIWTHLIGLLILISCGIFIGIRAHIKSNYIANMSTINATSSYDMHYYPSNWRESIVFGLFFFGACTCLTFSWLFHTLSCHSPTIKKIFNKLDYSGISILIASSTIPIIYYGFDCNKTLFIFYAIFTSLCSISGIVVAQIDSLSLPAYRTLRASVYLSLGCSGIIPVIHIIIANGYEVGRYQIALYHVITMGLFYIVGCLIYVVRLPEKLFPGKINLLFQSHQIFHVFVVIAATIYIKALCLMAEYNRIPKVVCKNPLN